MGNTCTACSRDQVSKLKDADTNAIDQMLETEKAKEALHFKILCLGAGESGKSTIIKQLTFIHKQTLSKDERMSYVRILQNNTVQCMTTLIQACENFVYELSDEEKQSANFILAHDQRINMPPDMANDIQLLWSSDNIKRAWSRRAEFWHLEATEYYFANVDRFVEQNFIPSDEDVVMARKRTTGVVTTEIEYGGVKFTCCDVGGQRSERRKWLNCFDNAKAIIFVVNLGGYCSVLFEDKSVIRMQESLNLFEQTMSNPLFFNIPVFLFLNKKDLFESLIRTKPITCCFPHYKGENDLRSCLDFIAQEYQKRLPPKRTKATVCLLAARVKKDVGYCFDEVKDVLLELNAKEIQRNKKALTKAEAKYSANDTKSYGE